MPIYEFYCPDCHTIFSFFSKTVNTAGRPACPKCGRDGLERQVSLFAPSRGGGTSGEGEADDGSVDEGRMERAMDALAGEVDHLNEDDPRQAARLMRQFSQMSGMELSGNMEAALGRLEAGEDPAKVEEDMGDLLNGEDDPFLVSGDKKGKGPGARCPRRSAPERDSRLYDM